MMKKAKEQGIVEYNFVNPRDFAKDNYKSIDDHPYGGGAGMVMSLEPMYGAVKSILSEEEFKNLLDKKELNRTAIILLSPRGETWKQNKSVEFANNYEHLIFIVPHFEGIDERVVEHLVTHEISIGDYVLTGGELPSLILTDSIVRMIPGVLGNEASNKDESFSRNLLEYPQYTKPSAFNVDGNKWIVPDVLVSGHHKNIEDWRKDQSEKITKEKRPDLLN